MSESGFRINFAGTAKPKPLTSMPAGMYKANVYELNWGKTGESARNPGEPKLTITFRISDGENEGRQVYRTYTFGEKARPFFLQLCEAIGGFTDDQLNGEADILPEEVDHHFQGTEVVISINRKQDRDFGMEDGFRNEVRNVYSVKSPQAQKVVSGPSDPRMP